VFCIQGFGLSIFENSSKALKLGNLGLFEEIMASLVESLM
jgi:hypothetical protein